MKKLRHCHPMYPPPLEFCGDFRRQKTRVPGLSVTLFAWLYV